MLAIQEPNPICHDCFHSDNAVIFADGVARCADDARCAANQRANYEATLNLSTEDFEAMASCPACGKLGGPFGDDDKCADVAACVIRAYDMPDDPYDDPLPPDGPATPDDRIVRGVNMGMTLSQCVHCGMRMRGALVVVAPTTPWGFWECMDKAACAERRAANLEGAAPRRCPDCGSDDWLVGGDQTAESLRCIDRSRCLAVQAANARGGERGGAA